MNPKTASAELIADDAPCISVIVPAYNVERFLAPCLDSILNQSLPDFEILVVNDCSPDGSGILAAGYARRDTRIRVIDRERNEGTMRARQAGYENARGRYIVFCDGDDLLPHDSLEILHSAISDGALDIVFGAFEEFFPYGRKKYLNRSRVPAIGREGVYQALIANKMHMVLWGAIYDARLFRDALETMERQCVNEDYMILLQLLGRAEKIKVIDDVTYLYRAQPDAITRRTPTLDVLRQELLANKWCLDFLVSRSIYPAAARKRYIRRVVQAMERGFSRRQIEQTGLLDKQLFTTRNILYYCGFRYFLKYSGLRIISRLISKS